MIMGDEAFQTKKNEPTHISLRCLEQAVCCIMYCNSGRIFPRSPVDVTSDDAECALDGLDTGRRSAVDPN